ncbi:cytidylate kinase-like family protein [Caproiciproducens galactitolivorans]|uniref:Cytidylate kinase n=1 Tax=Caproiciproducens galactitolivorans TaxID=642589 RepID=A0A4Z0YFR3_9FIRM|nr:cytidylate kinase-like family protein [Caproiciproducens galactitolivorans]QEY34452.1 cytidylate kinase-like family protein [Caproiciproducens galactitolivorans]TGJ77770.1 cytidylate kinase [Caproiciproducens galactitolivorans]
MNYAITIARGYGSGGRRIGQKLADKLNIDFVDRELLQLASIESGINEALFGQADERVKKSLLLFKNIRRSSHLGDVLKPEQNGFTSDENLFNYQAKVLRSLTEKESFVVMGRAADFILKDYPNVLSVNIQASQKFCVKAVMDLMGCSEKEAESRIEKIDRYRAEFYKYYTGRNWNNPENFDLCLNSERLGDDNCIRLIIECAKLKFGPDFNKRETEAE